MPTDPNKAVMEEFIGRCRDLRLDLKVWIGRPISLFGRQAVCYCGALGQCEEAENKIVQTVQRHHPKAEFCYVYPAPSIATSTLDKEPDHAN